MSQYAFNSATDLARAIQSKEISSLELTDMYIDRVETIDPEINAVVVKDFERGRQAAIDVDNESQDYFQQVFWSGLITVAHLPSTVFPTGPSADGLPIGLQAVSAEFHDYTCIDFANLLAQEIGGFVAPPRFS